MIARTATAFPMPVDRQPISVNQFCELLALDPKRLIGVEMDRKASTVVIVLEPEEKGQPRG